MCGHREHPTAATESWPRQACPGLPPTTAKPTAAAPRNGSFALPATGARRARSVRRRKLSNTSCCSAPAATTSAVSSSVFTAAWDFQTWA
ncbi:hypothetical protein MTO96_020284 [Rhipicephalus appendiculatus]